MDRVLDAGKTIGAFFLLTAGGAAIGWLAGLSATPIVATVISSLLALAVAVTSALAGIRAPTDNDKRSASLTAVVVYPVALLAIGIAVGASLGVKARTHNWLSPSPQKLVDPWVQQGLERRDVAKHFLDSLEPIEMESDKSKGGAKGGEERVAQEEDKEEATATKATSQGSTRNTVVWASPSNVHSRCEQLRNQMDHYDLMRIRQELNDLGKPFPGSIGEEIHDVSALRKVVNILCDVIR